MRRLASFLGVVLILTGCGVSALEKSDRRPVAKLRMDGIRKTDKASEVESIASVMEVEVDADDEMINLSQLEGMSVIKSGLRPLEENPRACPWFTLIHRISKT